jgi:hypothetical protein
MRATPDLPEHQTLYLAGGDRTQRSAYFVDHCTQQA